MGATSSRSARTIPCCPGQPDRVTLDTERVKHWLSVGAQPTDRVMRFLDAAGLAKRTASNNPNKAKPRKKRMEREAAAAEAARRPRVARPSLPHSAVIAAILGPVGKGRGDGQAC